MIGIVQVIEFVEHFYLFKNEINRILRIHDRDNKLQIFGFILNICLCISNFVGQEANHI